jgi:CubicO group peptidase (beta-lactamase class C family)
MALTVFARAKQVRLAVSFIFIAAAFLPGGAERSILAQSAPDFPAKDWQLVSPESEGYSSKKFEALRAWLAAGPTTAMMIVVHGHIIFSYGDTAKVSKIASVRKSILSMLYGKYVVNNIIDLNKTVEQLGLAEPDRPFLPSEKNATLEQLFAGRSGIYLLPEGVPPEKDLIMSSQPHRGSEFPGMYFHYNDWDFNAAGTAFEKLTGKNIYDALQTDFAEPIQMQDFDRSLQKKITHDGQVHPEYAMYLSTRDMARLGLLMLRNGNWAGKQLIPITWVQMSAEPVTPFEEMNPPYLRSLGAPERWASAPCGGPGTPAFFPATSTPRRSREHMKPAAQPASTSPFSPPRIWCWCTRSISMCTRSRRLVRRSGTRLRTWLFRRLVRGRASSGVGGGGFGVRLIEVRGFPPLRQKEGAKMGHGSVWGVKVPCRKTIYSRS